MFSIRTFLIYSLLLIAVIGSGWLAEKLAPPPDPRAAKTPGQVDYYSRNIHRTTSDINGKTLNLLVAEKLTHFQNDDHSELERPILTIYSADGPPWVIHGERGIVSSKSTDVFLEGPVLVLREADRNGRTVRAETSNVRIKPDEDYGETEDFVQIFSPPDELSGIGMQAHFGKALQVTVLSSVRRKHEFQKKPPPQSSTAAVKGSKSKGVKKP